MPWPNTGSSYPRDPTGPCLCFESECNRCRADIPRRSCGEALYSGLKGSGLVILSYLYRFASNFAFLALVYLSLNYLTKYNERTVIAFLVLLYCTMRIISTLRMFFFFQKIERLEAEVRSISISSPTENQIRKKSVREVALLRHQGELKAYIDLLFLTLVVLLCVSKIFTA